MSRPPARSSLEGGRGVHPQRGDRPRQHPSRSEYRERPAATDSNRFERADDTGAGDVDCTGIGGLERGDHRTGRVVAMQQRERGIGHGAHRHHRQAQITTEWTREMRTDEWRETQHRDRHVGDPAQPPRRGLNGGQRASERGGGIGWHRLVGGRGGSAPPPVHLEARPHHHDPQRRGGREGAEQIAGACVGVLRGLCGPKPGVGFVDAEMHHHVRSPRARGPLVLNRSPGVMR